MGSTLFEISEELIAIVTFERKWFVAVVVFGAKMLQEIAVTLKVFGIGVTKLTRMRSSKWNT